MKKIIVRGQFVGLFVVDPMEIGAINKNLKRHGA